MLRRLLGEHGAAVLAGSGAPAWGAAVERLRPGTTLRFPEPRDLAALDRYCATQGLRHVDLLRCGGDALLPALDGAERLLLHSRIGVISVDRAPAAAAGKAIAERLDRHSYRLFRPGLGGLRPLASGSMPHHGGPFLALHERLLPLVLDRPKAMLDIAALCRAHRITPRGIAHVGAHEGREWAEYRRMGADTVLFIEANPAVFARLAANLAGEPGAILANCAIAAQSGPVILHVTSSDQSSSILPLHRHRNYYPTIVETETLAIEGKTLDGLLAELRLPPERFNMLNIDIQGAEMQALIGATNLLPHIEAINIEVNFEELYEGCSEVDELDDFLAAHGFRRVATTCPFHKSWGDGFYVRAQPA